VTQPVYKTVPVTAYEPVRQTVKRPVIEKEYVSQPVTEYQPVTETRTAQVPTVTYENVTEHHTVQRDYGQWHTSHRPNVRVHPWDYDRRPGFFGWMNRTGYEFRSAFSPRYRSTRNYVPNVVSQVVPVTRQVARQGTRQVTYNVTRMVPHQTTRKVAVNRVRYVDTEVVTQRPVTVMQQVPVGSRVAYFPLGSTATALAPVIDPISRAAAPTSNRTAEKPQDNGFNSGGSQYQRGENGTSLDIDSQLDEFDPIQNSLRPAPQKLQASAKPVFAPASKAAPSIVRVNRWVARRPKSAAGPSLTNPNISIAKNNR
jgi:hypothetical protein